MSDSLRVGTRSETNISPEQEVGESATVGATAEAEPTTDVSEATPLDMSAAAGHDSKLERLVREQANHLGPGQSVEVELGAEAFAKYGAKADGKVKVSREEDGSFKVELEASGLVGLGAGEHAHAGHQAGAEAVGMAGVTFGAGTTFHFKNADQVAGFVDAAAGAGISVKSPTLALAGQYANVLDGNNALTKYAPFVEKAELSGGIGASGKLAVDFNVGAAKVGFKLAADVKVETQYEYDREHHKLIMRTSGSLQGGYGAAFGAGASASEKGTLIVEREVSMTDEDFQRCATDPRALARKVEQAFTAPPRLYAQHEGDANITGMQGHYQQTYDLQTGKTSTTMSVTKPGENLGGALGTGPVEVEGYVRKSREYHGATLKDCQNQAAKEAAHEQALEQQLAAARQRHA